MPSHTAKRWAATAPSALSLPLVFREFPVQSGGISWLLNLGRLLLLLLLLGWLLLRRHARARCRRLARLLHLLHL